MFVSVRDRRLAVADIFDVAKRDRGEI